MKAFLTFLTFDDGIKKYTACYEMVICVEYKGEPLNCCVEITVLGAFHVRKRKGSFGVGSVCPSAKRLSLGPKSESELLMK